MMDLQKRWIQGCLDLSIKADLLVFEKLICQYTEPHRYYHTLQHLKECFYYFDLIKNQIDQIDQPAIIEMAIWFHDAIYDVKGNQNELLSTALAKKTLTQLGLKSEFITKIVQLILMTEHNSQPKDLESQIIIDVDLAILGASTERFAEYEQQIRAEYSWVPKIIFNHKRKTILKNFLKQTAIYYTPILKELLEKQARINLLEATTA